MFTKQIAIIILNYKNYTDTINCIASIFEFSTERDFVIFVVDNASGNDSLSYIKTATTQKYSVTEADEATKAIPEETEIVLISNPENRGYAAGNNLGLKIAYSIGFKYLMVLNNDTLFIDNSLSMLKNTLDSKSDALCVGPVLLKEDGKSIDYNCAKRRPTLLDIFRFSLFGRLLRSDKWRENYYYMKKYPNASQPIEVDIISGSCMLFDAKKFHDIGFFDPDTFLYYEEAIIHEKARASNFTLMLDPRVKVIHLGAKTTKSHSNNTFTLQCEYNSLSLYLNKYRTDKGITAQLLLLSLKLSLSLYKLKIKLANAKLFI